MLHWFSKLPKEAIQGVTGTVGELVGVGSALGGLRLLDAAFGTGMAGGTARLLGRGLGLVGEGFGLGVAVPYLPELATLLALTQTANKGEEPLYNYDKGSGRWMPTGAPEPVLNTAAGAPVTAEVKGEAELKVSVEVAPTADFITRITTLIRNEINAFRASGGAPAVGTAGATGKSMPEAAPNPQ